MLIPRSILFGNPHRTNPEISPDGRHLGYLAPYEGVLNVWTGPLDGSRDPEPVTHDENRGIAAFGFCHDDRTLVYLQDTDGDENWRLYRLDLATGESRCVTPAGTVRTRILAHNRWHPTTILLGLDTPGGAMHDVYRLDLETDRLERITRNPGYASWLIDADLMVRGGIRVRDDGGAAIHLGSPESPWRTVAAEESRGTEVLGFDRHRSRLLLVSAENAETSRLLAVDVESGAQRVLAADDSADIARVELDPETREPQAAIFTKAREEWVFFDHVFGREVDQLRKLLSASGYDGELHIGRSERSGRIWLVSVLPSDGPLRYFSYDVRGSELRELFSYRPELDALPLATMEPFRFMARDGLDVSGYLTFPTDVEREKGGKGEKGENSPAVLLVHGGPWARDVWGYDPEVQWLANRGYVCVQVNFRGSTGFGKRFANLGDKEWGRRMQDDLVDAVRHCAEQGWIDPGRVGVMGTSYGGYAALAGAAFTPEVFRCAIDVCGPANLLTFLGSIPSYWKPLLSMLLARVGDPRTERDMLWERSPLSRVDAIRIPLLIAQGANDPRVRRTEAEQIVSALEARGIPHRYLLFEDEGHGLARPDNRALFYAEAERFLAEHLGGRCETM